MQNSIFLARLLGPAFAVMGIALAVQPKSFASIVEEFIASRALSYLVGLLALLAGLALVLTHNLWSADWRVLITLIGWIILVRALITVFLPGLINDVGSWFLAHRGGFVGGAALMLILGCILSYFGYST